MGQITLRIPDDIHTRARILAAFKDVSQNELYVQAIDSFLKGWEDKNGKIPLPPVKEIN